MAFLYVVTVFLIKYFINLTHLALSILRLLIQIRKKLMGQNVRQINRGGLVPPDNK